MSDNIFGTKRLNGKVAIVTGATGGIGRGIALALAARGAAVAVNGRNEQKAAAVLDEIESVGGTGIFVPGDVRDRDGMTAVVARTVQLLGRVDIVVPNAGGNDDEARDPRVRGPFAGIDLARATAFVGEALSAKLNIVQAAVPHLVEHGGSVVFVTSEGGREPTPGQTAMSAFAGGLVMTSKVLSKELAREGVRVNCVCVTVVRDSPSWAAVFDGETDVSPQHRKQYERIVQRSPLGVAAPGDIGDVVAFLASDESRFLTGAALSPTGGLTVH
ncbi:SDR family oxidoreductase [Gordonia sp. TBRC 11910]|uniref:3-oxoacyl-[acyl-carrier-protein] reductase MabA n=1 Tax=Gordonia asplenii TaxID=2725283 RepID=A0A848L3R0_9ACTN|nr:SDR family oxidoreductase [Gordonia asplenii]NMO03221.1 SDR family oxidoreductase [Gordonia asplenii]